MKKITKTSLIIFVFLFSWAILIGCTQEEQEEKVYCHATLEDEFVDNKLLVVLTHSASDSKLKYDKNNFQEVKCLEVRCLSNYNNPDDIIPDNFRRILSLTIPGHDKINVLNVIKILEKRKDIYAVEPNYYGTFDLSPNDEYASEQYANTSIDLTHVWDFTVGSKEITVGIIDSGIDGNHPDLRDSIDRDLSKCFTPDYSDPLDDDMGHGTCTAGVLAAAGNNTIGISGVSWKIKIISMRVDAVNKKFYSSSVIDAIKYSEEIGIDVLNLSLSAPGKSDDADVVAQNEAIKNFKGIVICTAGNDGVDIDSNKNLYYPACHDLPNLISVGAIDSKDGRWIGAYGKSSNYGQTKVQIYAPGASIHTTYPEKYGNSIHLDVNQLTKGYAVSSGTSVAAPYVAGVAALLLSVNPNLTPQEIKAAILNNADSITISPNNQTVKKLNAFRALKSIFNSNIIDSYSIGYGEKTIVKSISSNGSYFNDQNVMVRFSKQNSFSNGFKIHSDYPLSIKVYDADLKEIVVPSIPDGLCDYTFEDDFTQKPFYLKINFMNPDTAGTIQISIHEHKNKDHYCTNCNKYIESHDYHDPYTWINYTQHRATCGCGDQTNKGHVISSSTYAFGGGKYATCMLCGGSAQIGFVTTLQSSTIVFRSKNGSFILPNGVIVLVDKDLEAYLEGILTFEKANNIETSQYSFELFS